MRKFISFVFVLLVFFCIKGYSQKQEFYITPQIGLLNGDNNVSATINLSGGIVYKKWNYGIGAGMDYYKFRSIPLYAEVKRMFGDKRKTPFLYANAGWNIAWVLENQKPLHYDWISDPSYSLVKSNFKNGVFVESGVGVNLNNKKGKGFLMSLGYSTKTLSDKWTEPVWDPEKSEYFSFQRSARYTFNRVVLKFGFRLL